MPDYEAPTFVNDSGVALNATTLNKLAGAVEDHGARLAGGVDEAGNTVVKVSASGAAVGKLLAPRQVVAGEVTEWGLVNGSGVFNVKDYGATGLSSTGDDTAAIQAAIAAAAAAGGGTVHLPRGTYRLSAPITIPENKPVALVGDRPGHVGAGAVSVLARKVGYTGSLIVAAGTGGHGGAAQRIYCRIADLQINGTAVAGDPLVDISRASEADLERVHFWGNTGTLLKATEWFNSHISHCFFQSGGNGRTAPAVLFDAPPADTGTMSGNTVHLLACEWESNTGTDLKITGSPDWALAILVTAPKMERDTGDYPLIDLDRAGACQFSDGFFHLGPSATAPHLEQKGTAAVPSRPNGFANCEFSGNKWTGAGAGSAAAVPYFIDLTVGSLLLSNVSMNGAPTTAFIHVGSGIGLSDLRMSSVAVTDRSKLLHDERAGSQQGYGSVSLVPVIQGVTPTSSVNRAVWVLPDAATTRLTFATVSIPADAAPGRPLRVRLLWYSDVAAGAVRWTVGYRWLAPDGFDITQGSSDVGLTVTVPGTANTTKTTVIASSMTVQPAQFLAVYLERVGADAADTCTGSARVLAVEMQYERAL